MNTPYETPHIKHVLYIILAAALVLHLLSNVGMFMFRPEAISTTPDPLDYRLAALNLLDHGTFSLAPPEYNADQLLRTPGYPLLLAATYLLDGRTGLAMIVLQSMLLVGMGWILFHLLRAFRIPSKISLVLVAVFLLEPLQWLYTLHTMTETVASFLILGVVAGALVGSGISTWVRAALFGAGLGLLLLVKPSATMWLPFLLPLIFFAHGTLRARISRALVAVLALFVVIAPWLYRNMELVGAPILSSTGPFNLVLFAGTPETVPSEYWDVVTVASYNGHSNQVWYAYTAEAYPMLKETQARILASADYGLLIVKQLAYAPIVWFGFTSPEGVQSYGHNYSMIADFILGKQEARNTVINVIDTTIWAVLLVLALLGTYMLLRDPARGLRFLPLLCLVLITVFINFCGSWARMLIPTYPVILLATGAGVTYLLERLPRRAL